MAGKYRNLYYGLNKYVFSLLPDSLYHNLLGWIMHRRFGIKYNYMNIKRPQTFSEKLQWMKSHGDIDLKTKLADKFDVREFVRQRIGEIHLVDLLPINKNNELAVTSEQDIDWDMLPNQFAMKLTKGSGFNIICSDKSKLNIDSTIKQLKKWLSINNYYLSREPQYKGKNKIIIEKLLKYNITDYKFFCFDGEPTFVELYIDRLGNHRKIFYDMKWQKAGFTTAGDSMDGEAAMPEVFSEMVDIARKLANGFPLVRVDLYENEGKVYFGEMTFHPAGGYTPITPREWDYKLGNMIKI